MEETAFSNLARCPHPKHIDDDDAILACQESFPVRKLVEAIDARLIFVAKLGIANGLEIPGEYDGSRIVVRYGGGSRGERGREHYTKWISKEMPRILKFIGK